MTRKNLLWKLGPSLGALALVFVIYKYVNPAPPTHLVISTGDGEGDYQTYAKLYKDIMKEDGVTLEIRSSTGAVENLQRLQDPKSDVSVGFVQDGLGSPDEAPDLSSLGSLYYEPIWVFYRSALNLGRFSQLQGKRIAIGHEGGGTRSLATKLLSATGVTSANSRFVMLGQKQAEDSLRKGEIDAAFFMATPEDEEIRRMIEDPLLKLMNVDQAEAISRKFPFLHHLVLPRGAVDLQKGLPAKDVDLIAPTATLLAKDSLHPALIYLLLKAASQVHSDPGIFERKNEFPMHKDDQFPLSDEAKNFYKSGAPFWQRYLPFWLATLVERFLLLVIPMLALVLPVFRAIPKFKDWRIKSRIYQRYGELKFLETQIQPDSRKEHYAEYLKKLDAIEDRVNQMKVPLDYSEHLYGLREHIHFVRGRLEQKRTMTVTSSSPAPL